MTRWLVIPLLCILPARASSQEPAHAPSQETSTYRPGFDALDYSFTIRLPDTGAVIRGDATISVLRTAPGDTLTLDLRFLRVERVEVGGRQQSFSRTDSTLAIPLPPGSGDTLSVRVVYGGLVTDGLIARRDSAGRWTHFGDNWPNRARYWLPTIDHPSDKATVSWAVDAPRTRTVVANGARVPQSAGRATRSTRTVTRWRERQPIPTYLMVIGAGPLARIDLPQSACGNAELGRCVEQQVYVAPELRGTLPGNFAQADDIVGWLASTVGPFPYEKLAHVHSATRFGGMENASAIFYSDNAFRRGGVGENLIAHETAHQWFGDAVTEREWSHLWLSEGFATYFAALWSETSRGDSALRADMTRIRATILRDTVAVPQRPVIDTAQTDLMRLLNPNSYQKGGFFLHMLRGAVGDSAFFAGVRDYYMRFRHGTALTRDFQDAVERASRRDLGAFFDQWLRRPGYPEIDVSWQADSASRTVTVSVTQGDRFGHFEFPLRLALIGEDGVPRRVEFGVPAQPVTTVQLPISQMVREVVVDPDVQLLARISPR